VRWFRRAVHGHGITVCMHCGLGLAKRACPSSVISPTTVFGQTTREAVTRVEDGWGERTRVAFFDGS